MAASKRANVTALPWLKLIFSPGFVTADTLAHDYPRADATNSPRLVTFLPQDPADPKNFPPWLRWALCAGAGYITFSVAFISSAYASGVPQIANDLHTSPQIATVGLSLFVFGFCLGPLLWAPTSESIGRQPVLLFSTLAHVALNVALCFSPNIACLLLLRLLSGACGAAPLTNSGGVIADIFPPEERGLAITVYALVPLFAPVLGPIVGGSVAQGLGWRGLMAVMALLSMLSLVLVIIAIPETFAPVLLRKRAQKLSKITQELHVSAIDFQADSHHHSSSRTSLLKTLARPWQLAAHEPVIALLALYQAVIFGTLYMTFAAFPLVYAGRGWSQSMSGLSFLGLLAGTLCSVLFELQNNRRYVERLRAGQATPETRLMGCCLGGFCIVIGLFWFAFTTHPHIHPLVSVAAGLPFGFGVVLITIGSTNYLIDSYTLFAASALTVCIVARAVFAAAFPLFVHRLFDGLGVQWAMTIPALVALAFLPFPFVLQREGPRIRAHSKHAQQQSAGPVSSPNETTSLLRASPQMDSP